MLYQHLPEPMRNKETFDWMLSNPEYRKQLAQTLKAQVRRIFLFGRLQAILHTWSCLSPRRPFDIRIRCVQGCKQHLPVAS